MHVRVLARVSVFACLCVCVCVCVCVCDGLGGGGGGVRRWNERPRSARVRLAYLLWLVPLFMSTSACSRARVCVYVTGAGAGECEDGMNGRGLHAYVFLLWLVPLFMYTSACASMCVCVCVCKRARVRARARVYVCAQINFATALQQCKLYMYLPADGLWH